MNMNVNFPLINLTWCLTHTDLITITPHQIIALCTSAGTWRDINMKMNEHIPPNSGAGMRSEVPVYGYAAD